MTSELEQTNRQLQAEISALKTKLATYERQEKNLLESENRLRTVINAVKDGIIFSDEAGHFSIFNAEMERLTGYTEAEVNQSQDFNALIYPDPDKRHAAMLRLRQLIDTGAGSESETAIRCKTGTDKAVIVSTAIVELGKKPMFLSSFHDITERKNAEEELKRHHDLLEETVAHRTAELRQSEERFRTLVNSMDDFVFTLDHEKSFAGVYGNWLHQEGFLASMFLGRQLRDVFGAEAVKPLEGALQAAFSGEHVFIEWAFSKSNKAYYMHTSLSPLRDATGSIGGIVGVSRDISIRKRMEEALLDSETRYRMLVETMNDGLIMVNEQFLITYANTRFEEMLGYAREELIQKPLANLLDEENMRILDEQKEKRKRNESVPYELAYTRKNGEKLYTITSPRPLWNRSGIFCGSFGVITDITEHKKAARVLQEREARMNAIIKGFDGLIYICSPNKRIEFMNDNLIKRIGFDGTGLPCHEAVYDFTENCSWCLNERVLKGETVRWEMQNPKDNCWYYVVNTPVYNADGSMSIQSMIMDITDSKLSVQALIDSETRWHTLFEDSPISLWEEDFSACKQKLDTIVASGVEDMRRYLDDHPEAVKELAEQVKIIDINKATLSLYQVSTKEEVRSGLTKFLSSDAFPVFKEEILALFYGYSYYEVETVNQTLLGEIKNIMLRMCLAPGYEASWSKIIISIIDITDLKEAEKQIKLSLKEKDVLLAEVHHRVKNNLQVISGLLDMSRRRAKNAETVQVLEDAGEKIHAMALIHSLLYQTSSMTSVDMGEFIWNLVDHIDQVYSGRARNIIPAIESSRILLPVTQAIPCAIILNEVLSNVYKHAFAEGQGGAVQVRIANTSEHDGDWVHISVKDNGRGIPEGIDSERSETLGLKLIRNLVQKQLHGDLRMTSDQGTEIQIDFKVAAKEGMA